MPSYYLKYIEDLCTEPCDANTAPTQFQPCSPIQFAASLHDQSNVSTDAQNAQLNYSVKSNRDAI